MKTKNQKQLMIVLLAVLLTSLIIVVWLNNRVAAVGSVDIEEYVMDAFGKWVDADSASGPSITDAIDPVQFSVVVTNTGEVSLDVSVLDDLYGSVTLNATTLQPGGVAIGNYSIAWASGQQVNNATVTGAYDGDLFTDWDEAYYMGAPKFQIIGGKVLDKFGREIRFKGFQLWNNKIRFGGSTYNGFYTQEDYDQIKSWGFNTIYTTIFWSYLQPYKNEPDNIEQDWLNSLEDHMRMAERAGLYWVFEFRVQYNDDNDGTVYNFRDVTNLPDASWVCTREGLNQYKRYVQKIIQHFEDGNHPNLIGYNAWMMPFHDSSYTAEQSSFFYEYVLPELTEIVRKTGKLIFASPIHQSCLQLGKIYPVEDDVIYGVGFYEYENMTHGTEYITEWNYDYEYQIDYLQPAIDFKNTHNVPLYTVEFGVRGDTKPQADCLEYKCKLLEENGFSGWRYWVYANNWGTPSFSILYEDNTPKELILSALRKYNQTVY
jgi:hypothetical protein